MLYCCEVCGKKHTTEEQALECEKAHREEQARKEELAKEKTERAKAVSDKFDEFLAEKKKFEDDYGETLMIALTDSNYRNTLKDLLDTFTFWTSVIK